MSNSIKKYINIVEGFDARKHEMNPDQVTDLADDALNVAIKYIQDRLNVPTGDYAGMFFADQNKDIMIRILAKYIVGEIKDQKFKLGN